PPRSPPPSPSPPTPLPPGGGRWQRRAAPPPLTPRRRLPLPLGGPQLVHAQVASRAPLGPRHVPQPRRHQHQRRLAVGERPHHPRPPLDLQVQPLQRVVRPDARPVL